MKENGDGIGKYILWGFAIYGAANIALNALTVMTMRTAMAIRTAGILTQKSFDEISGIGASAKRGGVSPLSVPRSFRAQNTRNPVGTWLDSTRLYRSPIINSVTSSGRRLY